MLLGSEGSEGRKLGFGPDEFEAAVEDIKKREKLGKSYTEQQFRLELRARLLAYGAALNVESPMELVTNPKYRAAGSLVATLHEAHEDEVDAQVMHSAIHDFIAHRCLAAGDNPPWFEIEDELAWCFLATDLRGVRCDDVTLPFPGAVLSIPKGAFKLTSDTGTHEVLAATVAHSCGTNGSEWRDAHPEGVYVLLWAGRGSEGPDFDNATLFFYVPLVAGEEIEAAHQRMLATDADSERRFNNGRTVGYFGDKPLKMSELRDIVLRYVVNTLVYIASPQGGIRRKFEDEITKLESKGKKARDTDKARAKRLREEQRYVVHTTLKLQPGLKEAVLGSGGGATWSLKYKTWVRGHWRNQAHGKGRLDRKLIFIQPFVRGGDHLPTEAATHTYEVK